MEASAAGARAHRSVRAGQAVRVCLLVSLPTLELPVFSEGVWGGKRALRWDVGVWWGTGVRWDPSHVEGTGMSWDHGWFAASNPGHVLWVGAGGGVPPGEVGTLYPEAEVVWELWGIGAGTGLPTAPSGGQTMCMGCSVPDTYRLVTPSLQVTHDVSWGPSSWKPSGNEFWVTEPRLAKLTNHPFLALNRSEGGCV